jgi:hypothetical protein
MLLQTPNISPITRSANFNASVIRIASAPGPAARREYDEDIGGRLSLKIINPWVHGTTGSVAGERGAVTIGVVCCRDLQSVHLTLHRAITPGLRHGRLNCSFVLSQRPGEPLDLGTVRCVDATRAGSAKLHRVRVASGVTTKQSRLKVGTVGRRAAFTR